MKKSVLFLTWGLLLGSGCASKFFIPGNRFLTPESSGATWKGNYFVGGVGVTDVQTADDITSATPNTTPVLIKNSTFGWGLNLGVGERTDLYYASVMSAPQMAGVKYQLVGAPGGKGKSGAFTMALAAGLAFGSSKLSSSSSNVTADAKTSFSGYEAILLLGYRFNDSFLTYLNPFMTHVKAGVEITRSASGATTVTSPDGAGDMKGLTFGLRFGQSTYLAAEATLTETEYSRTNPTTLAGNKFTDTALGVAIGGSF